jgi:hypothetical protein
MRFPGFIGPSYTLQSVNVDCQRCVNLYPEINELGTGKEREVASLVPTPGLRLLVTVGSSGGWRGVWRASNDQVFGVVGNKFYRVSSAWVATELGSLNTSTGPVSMADNGLHVFIVDGTYGYTLELATSTLAQVTDPDFYASDLVTFQDGYFIFNRKDSQQFFVSDLNSVDFLGTDIATAEGSPDNLVGCISANQNLYLFGTQSTEVYYNSGDGDPPFSRIQGAINGVGCAAVHSIAKIQGVPYWIGGDETGTGIVYRMQGYQAQRISTPAIESVIRSIPVSDLANARAWTYQQGGHLFYCLNLTGHDATWVYDATTGFWHERTYTGLWSQERHRAECHAVAHGLNVVGDYENGNLYALDPEKYTDNGTVIARERTAPHVSQGMKNIFHHAFQLDLEVGVGLDGTGQGTDPQVMLQWSDDGGHTWSDERWRPIGKIGQTKKRVVWNRLGCSRDRVYRVKVTDPVKVVLIGAELTTEEGAA